MPSRTFSLFPIRSLIPFSSTFLSLPRSLVSGEFQSETQTLRFSTKRQGTKKTRWPHWCRPRDRNESTHIDIDQLFVRTAAISTSFSCASASLHFERIYGGEAPDNGFPRAGWIISGSRWNTERSFLKNLQCEFARPCNRLESRLSCTGDF